MQRLVAIWDQIGIENDQRKAREAVVLRRVNDLLNDMVGEEDQLRQRMLDNVQKFSSQFSGVARELHLPVCEPDDSFPPVHELEKKKLREKLEELESVKQEHHERLLVLTTADANLARRLCVGVFLIDSKVTPSLRQLESLEEHIRELEEEKERRQKLFCDVRKKVLQILHELDKKPGTGFERDVVESNLELISLATDNIERARCYHDKLARLLATNKNKVNDLWIKVKALWVRLDIPSDEVKEFEKKVTNCSNHAVNELNRELDRCEQLKLLNIQNIILKLRDELVGWWDRCFVLVEHRMTFRPFDEEPATEELMLRHEMELRAVKSHYEDKAKIFEKVECWHGLWEQFLTLERKARNPDRLNTRGGKLTKEEKTRKKLTVDLPKIELLVTAQIDEYEKSSRKQFLVSGMTFRDYTRAEHENFATEKENEKLSRQQQKAKQLEDELMYGSRPLTTGVKRFATPSKCTPGKRRKIGTLSKASIYGSHENLTNLHSPSLILSRDKFDPSVPRGLNNLGLHPKTTKIDLPRNGGKTFASAFCGVQVGSGSTDTISSGKSVVPGRGNGAVIQDRECESEFKRRRIATEPYF